MEGKRHLLSLPADLLFLHVTHLPGEMGRIVRRRFWGKRLKHLGRNVRIEPGVFFANPENISIDDDAWIDRNVQVLAGPDRSDRPRREIGNDQFRLERGHVHIGRRVHLASGAQVLGLGGVQIGDDSCLAGGARIISFSNHYRNEVDVDQPCTFSSAAYGGAHSQFLIEGPVTLGRNVGLASNAMVLPGVHLGPDCFVTIASVVKRSFPGNSLLTGNPAERIRARFPGQDDPDGGRE
ncbi:MAG: hypothetical protein ABIK09_18745 [Pseudomonadota bacterium]